MEGGALVVGVEVVEVGGVEGVAEMVVGTDDWALGGVRKDIHPPGGLTFDGAVAIVVVAISLEPQAISVALYQESSESLQGWLRAAVV